MKLMIIMLCMLLERYGDDFSSIRQVKWFHQAVGYFEKVIPFHYPWVILGSVLIVTWIVLWLLFLVLGGWFWGGLGVLMQAVIFFYCMGPQAIFKASPKTFHPADYFIQVNERWFSLVCWYILLGLFGAVTYRVITWLKKDKFLKKTATVVTDYLEWLPARIVSLFYLLVGHFQTAFPFWASHWLSGVEHNTMLLSESAIRAICKDEKKQLIRAQDAEQIVWYASILMLVCLAFLVLGAWL